MRDNFGRALAFALQYEGGYVNHPKDPGGPTNMGITIATLSHELGRRASILEVKNLTVEQAGAIYRKKYWNAIGANDLPAGVDILAFDIAVNSGVGRALQWLEKTRGLQPRQRVAALDRTRVGFYRALRTFPVFGKGWLRRESACLAVALACLGKPA